MRAQGTSRLFEMKAPGDLPPRGVDRAPDFL